jgi:beta-lactam-binding protein with PASTA domain/tRNA A-37 threonylcarbamoyl transferase component Bud32
MSPANPTVFSGRYEVQRPLARGGMAEVFLARDQLLDRAVAVKVLSSEYANDPSFVERFKREAQAAANLNHPNIVAIYDWGQEEGTSFIVMEYVEGRTLADILRSDGPLHPDRAADIAIDVASALAVAHRSGLVHRDVKPGNVLVTPTGQVKVTDFGIAVPSTTVNDLTQVGTVMGTATYFSPEQAQGKPCDPRSDLYSLGVVLYEMLVGRPPFDGDAPVTIALKHVQELPLSPNTVGAHIAESLDAITMKLLAKEPVNRYPSANDLVADLRRYREGMHRVGRAAAAAAVVAPTAAVAATSMLPVTSTGPQYATYPDAGGLPPVYHEPPRRSGTGGRLAIFSVLLVVLLIVLTALLLVFLTGNDKKTPAASLVAVPDLFGKTEQEATALIQGAGLQLNAPLRVVNVTVEAGKVFAQDPAAGVKIDPTARKVTITVSAGNAAAPVPNVIGSQQTVAENALRSSGFEVTVEPRADATRPEGEVIDQDPKVGSSLPTGQPVKIIVSTGAESVNVPDVAGWPATTALLALQKLGFDVVEQKESSATVPLGTVIRTDPKLPQNLKKGTKITVVTSDGVPQVPVSSVVGLSTVAARGFLEQAGFKVDVAFQDLAAGSPNIGRVISVSPTEGTKVPQGSTVTMTVGRGPVATTTTPAPPTTTVVGSTTTTKKP